jgi:hypothetical protein
MREIKIQRFFEKGSEIFGPDVLTFDRCGEEYSALHVKCNLLDCRCINTSLVPRVRGACLQCCKLNALALLKCVQDGQRLLLGQAVELRAAATQVNSVGEGFSHSGSSPGAARFEEVSI